MEGSKLFQVTTQPTLKMYTLLNRVNSQRSISLRVFLALACVLGVCGVVSIVKGFLGLEGGGLAQGAFWTLIGVAYVVFYLKGHVLLAEKSMRVQGKDAYLEVVCTFYEDRVDVRTAKTRGSVRMSSINRVYEDDQYYYLSYDRNNVTKSYVVVDKEGFTLGNPSDFKEYVDRHIAYNREYAKRMKKDNKIKKSR